jgi:hypothetical protein
MGQAVEDKPLVLVQATEDEPLGQATGVQWLDSWRIANMSNVK